MVSIGGGTGASDIDTAGCVGSTTGASPSACTAAFPILAALRDLEVPFFTDLVSVLALAFFWTSVEADDCAFNVGSFGVGWSTSEAGLSVGAVDVDWCGGSKSRFKQHYFKACRMVFPRLMDAPWDQALRIQLLRWIEPNPAPLLRRLYDCGLLGQPEYFSLLETSPKANQVISLLDRVSQEPEGRERFLHELRDLQEAYCPELQNWIQQTCREEEEKREAPPSQPSMVLPASPKEVILPSGNFGNTRNSRLQRSLLDSDLTFRRALSRQVKAALQSHRRWLMTRTEKLCTNVDDSESCGHIEVRYTELLLSNSPSSGSTSHDYLQLASRRARLYSLHAPRRLALRQLFSLLPGECSPPHRVMLSGAAGIGKSVTAQKILHDWALGAAFQKFLCVVDFSFRELGLMATSQSLEDLIRAKHPHLSRVLHELLEQPGELMVILDGLDEFRHPLDSKNSCFQVDQPCHIKDLVQGLLSGSLLPGSTVVVTSRPSATLPEDSFDRCFVILGFQEEQVKEYFSRFFRDPERAAAVLSYVSAQKGLASLSFIPLYCFILCTALGEFFSRVGAREASPPSTITEVYRQYLCTILRPHASAQQQARGPNCALGRSQGLVLQLGKLAYSALLRGKIQFDIGELREFGFDPQNLPGAFLNRIFTKEKDDGYRFFHLTVQEFLAALYSVAILDPSAQELTACLDLWWDGMARDGNELPSLSKNGLLGFTRELLNGHYQWGHLQMFSRFFMGLLTSRIGGRLAGLTVGLTGDPLVPLAAWLREKVPYESDQRLLTLLHCLAELRQDRVTQQAASKLDEVDLFKVTLNPADCAALAYVLSCSEPKTLRNLNLSYSNMGIGGLRRLQGLLHRCETLQLRYNSLDWEAAAIEAAVLRSPDCRVKRLLFCGNCLGSEGVKSLWDALRENTTLQELYLDITGITDSGLDNILVSLEGNTTLRLLTIVGNRLSEAGKQILSELSRRKPDLKIISSFLTDMGLLQAYLDWVEEIKADPEQMESVKNADALHSVLEVLPETKDTGACPEAWERAQHLKKQIRALLREDESGEGGHPEACLA
ncbi:PREDICTED: NACHT, LRR and PYD domains-containing protein 12-like [Gekko japonicus]|uniref:NACHT, LRR and PYD domains-containing protein 12-like n=1 Tax=Gekko japonicus TaxID=146911 RepID=A0ABM1KTK0_GEKJA|nr:PREDICTED: NACHT, LRR and PYD domains-containing protein 12-like [Gekko japonicus]